MGATFTTASGGDPAQYFLNLASRTRITEGDALYAAQRQRSRIIERTLRGVDVNGAPFEPYDRSRPYYYYPGGRVGRTKAEVNRNKGSVRRLLKITGEVAQYRSEFTGSMSVGGVRTRDGQGIRFESYADFKESLGRAGVDLTGPRAPHMLQAIGIQTSNHGFASVGDDQSDTALSRFVDSVSEFVIGIFGDAAGRASGHNTGFNPRWKRRHQRYFFGASADDIKEMMSELMEHMKARWGNG